MCGFIEVPLCNALPHTTQKRQDAADPISLGDMNEGAFRIVVSTWLAIGLLAAGEADDGAALSRSDVLPFEAQRALGVTFRRGHAGEHAVSQEATVANARVGSGSQSNVVSVEYGWFSDRQVAVTTEVWLVAFSRTRVASGGRPSTEDNTELITVVDAKTGEVTESVSYR
jgi:hypothetical protein